MSGVWMYILVFVLETICQLLSAMRIIYINNSKSFAASVICFFENGFFAVAMGAVIADVTSDPLKALIYCVAFSAGVYLGAKLEKVIASGHVSVEVCCPAADTQKLTNALQAGNIRFFLVPCTDCQNRVLMKLPRRKQQQVVKIARTISADIDITVRDLEELHERVS